MSKPPKLSLAAIVAAATPAERVAPRPATSKSSATPSTRSSAARHAESNLTALRPKTAEIVALSITPAPRPATTLKQRARQMSVYLEPPVYDQLRDLAYAERSKMHTLMLEALDLLFKQRGTRSIAQLADSQNR